MNPQELVEQCKALGVKVHLVGDEIKLVGASRAARLATKRLRPYKLQLLRLLREQRSDESAHQRMDLLDRFEFNRVVTDPASHELTRVNNICYRLVSVNGWAFEEAMEAAANWVVANPQHPDEDSFVDVLALWKERQ